MSPSTERTGPAVASQTNPPAAAAPAANPAGPSVFPGVRCPFCEAANSELIALFGSQLLLSQYRCTQCGSYFEAVRGDDDDGS